jgi:hypothetical protein
VKVVKEQGVNPFFKRFHSRFISLTDLLRGGHQFEENHCAAQRHTCDRLIICD